MKGNHCHQFSTYLVQRHFHPNDLPDVIQANDVNFIYSSEVEVETFRKEYVVSPIKVH